MAERIFNFLVALIAILLIWPFWLIIMLVILCVSPGPPIYKAKRVGKNGKLFTLYKFRSMRVDSGKVKITTLGNDDRVFPFGRFLRKSKLDETPQILNILKGDMSIVGFRPEDEANAAQVFEGDYQKILSIKPGLTSPASLLDYTHGERYESEEAYIQEFLPLKMEMELYYAENKRFFYDLRLIFRTAKIILQKIFGKEDFPYPPEYAAVADRLAAKQNASATEPTTAQKG